MIETKKHHDLTELLLFNIRVRPAMYLSQATILSLTAFLTGFMLGGGIEDEYFGKNGFLEWFWKKYKIINPNAWQTVFLDEADGDQEKALEVYFGYLEEYHKEK